MVKVKICGLCDPETVALAAGAGADWIGLVFVAASPRAVTPADTPALIAAAGPAVPVALMSDPDDRLVGTVAGLGLPVLQLHGRETPERVAAIRAMTGCEVWKAVGVSTREDLDAAARFDAAERLLLDAKPPAGAARSGGHGAAFDWAVLAGWQAPKPWLLAGGLTPQTVAGAIAATGAEAVDVSSGVEVRQGVKDADLIRRFVAAAKAV